MKCFEYDNETLTILRITKIKTRFRSFNGILIMHEEWICHAHKQTETNSLWRSSFVSFQFSNRKRTSESCANWTRMRNSFGAIDIAVNELELFHGTRINKISIVLDPIRDYRFVAISWWQRNVIIGVNYEWISHCCRQQWLTQTPKKTHFLTCRNKTIKVNKVEWQRDVWLCGGCDAEINIRSRCNSSSQIYTFVFSFQLFLFFISLALEFASISFFVLDGFICLQVISLTNVKHFFSFFLFTFTFVRLFVIQTRANELTKWRSEEKCVLRQRTASCCGSGLD